MPTTRQRNECEGHLVLWKIPVPNAHKETRKKRVPSTTRGILNAAAIQSQRHLDGRAVPISRRRRRAFLSTAVFAVTPSSLAPLLSDTFKMT